MNKNKIILNKPQIVLDNDKLKKMQELVDLFEHNKKQYTSTAYDESNTRSDFIDKFFALLDWDLNNDQGYAEQYREVVREDKVEIDGQQKAPDYSFRVGGQKKFFVEAKKPSVNIKDDIGPAFQLRRYAYSANLPLSILTDFEEFSVYDTRIKPNANDKASVARVFYCKFDEYIDNFEYLFNTFSKNAILKGSFDQYVEDKKKQKGTSEVDKEFLKLIETWRSDLAKNIALRNKSLDIYALNESVQKIIDRIIFLRIAEDRNIEKYKTLDAIVKKQNCYKLLAEYFVKADAKYNSGLFKVEEWLNKIKVDDNVLKSIITTLYYPESPYVFSEIPVEIIGQIYEQFLGKTIHLTKSHQAKIEEKPEVRKAGGVYYTPAYIVDYIVKNTVGEMIKSKTPEKVAELNILDPACGSGSFLLGAYNFLLNWHLDYYTDKKRLEKSLKQSKIYNFKNGFKLTFATKKSILTNNLYGVDIDSQAVEVTKLSLLLKLMEDETQESATQLLKFDKQGLLPNLSANIKCGNSLIGSDFYEGQISLLDDEVKSRKINVFDWEDKVKGFGEIMDRGGFDVVIGNPPYVVLGADNFGIPYFKSKYHVSRGGKSNLYKLFIEKSHSLLKKLGSLGFICPSNYLSSADSFELRKLLLNQTKLKEIIEYTEKDKVFEDVTQALTTIIFQKENNTKGSLHLVTSKHGDVTGKQSQFLLNKGFEFIFSNKVILKIKKNKKLFKDFIDGYQGEINVSTYKDFFTDSSKKEFSPLLRGNQITSYYILADSKEYCPLSVDKRGHWKRERLVFQEVSNQQQQRRVRGAIVGKGVLCGHTTNYCFVNNNYISNFFILALLNSKVVNYYFSYFNKTNHVPIGEIKSIPFPDINFTLDLNKNRIASINLHVKQMLEAQKKYHSAKTESDKELHKKKIDILDKQIDGEVYELYGLGDKEVQVIENN